MPTRSHHEELVCTAPSAEVGGTDAAAIGRQLERVLASPHLCQSKRCQALLKHVVEAYLDGCLDKVKERCIGFEVFQRDADYDTSRDSIVRTTAAEVRKRLAQYYLEPEHEHELRIILPHGSYSPEFRVAPVPVAAAPPKAHQGRLTPVTIVSAAALVLGAAIAVYASRPSEMDLFWRPFWQDRADAVICIEQPLRIFRFTGPRKDELNQEMVGEQQTPPATAEVRDSTQVKLSELEPTGQAYFSYGDLISTARISEMFARRGKRFELLGDRITAYRDLRGRPAVLLGQFNNQWTLGLTSGLRFYLDKDATRQQYLVRDRNQTGKIVASVPKERREEDLAVVSRIFDVATEKTVVAVVGSTYLGTLAAGDFLTHTSYMSQAFHDAPAGWYRNNIQVVLKAPTVRGTAGPPQVIATYFW
ncbi:MAG TPA: hypothetical protein VKB88_00070 [Bryobacteraceae bacterium]|nr:hypothetical protein [Bryobacteraceae bacterium]